MWGVWGSVGRGVRKCVGVWEDKRRGLGCVWGSVGELSGECRECKEVLRRYGKVWGEERKNVLESVGGGVEVVKKQ